MKLRLRAILVSALALSVSVASAAPESVRIEKKYQPGTYTNHITSTTVTQPVMSGQRMAEQKMMMQQWLDFVISKPDAKGVKKITMSFRRIKVAQDMGMMNLHYDSASETKPAGQAAMLANIYEPMLKAKVVFTVTDGKITSVKGMEEVFEKMAKANPAFKPLGKAIKAQFSSKQLQMMIGLNEDMMPPKNVAVGQKWENDFSVPGIGLGKLTGKIIQTLKSVKDGKAVIGLQGSLKGKGDFPAMQGVKMTTEKFAGEITGQYTWDQDLGMATSSRNVTKFAMSMRIQGNGQDIGMNMEGTTTAETDIKKVK